MLLAFPVRSYAILFYLVLLVMTAVTPYVTMFVNDVINKRVHTSAPVNIDLVN